MAVLSVAEIIAELSESAARMQEVRDAAEKLRLIRQGPEPEPTSLPGGVGQPLPEFTGQVERPDGATG